MYSVFSVRIDNVPKQCAELYTYNLYNGENEMGPDSRYACAVIVLYSILECIVSD